MARLASLQRGGFYPAHPNAIRNVLEHLRPPDGPFSMCDPCAGRGEAVKQLADGLGCLPANLHAIELSDTRAEECKQLLVGARVLAPCSFEGTTISVRDFGFMYLNPPYSTEMGGGSRAEFTFLLRATKLIKTGGVLAFVLPEYVLNDDEQIQKHLRANYRDLSVLPFPEEHRQYDEAVCFGVKRGGPVAEAAWEHGWESRTVPVYDIPLSDNPIRFEKTCLTDSEIIELIQHSPLRKAILSVEEEDTIPRPPIPLGIGHTALLVASGHLDGLVKPPDEPPHVVRGTVRKTQYLSKQEVSEDAKGRMSTTSIYSERISPVVRVATQDGTIITLGEVKDDE